MSEPGIDSEYLAQQIFFYVLLQGGHGNPFTAINNEWFVELAAKRIAELLSSDSSVKCSSCGGSSNSTMNGMCLLCFQADRANKAESALSDNKFVCLARKAGTAGGNDPQDCDWPRCGCDPYANKVLDTIDESGFAIVPKSGEAK